MNDFKLQILKLEYALGLTKTALKDDLLKRNANDALGVGENEFHIKIDASDEEIEKYLKYKNARNINIIKNCVIFFTVLTALGILASIVYISNLSTPTL